MLTTLIGLVALAALILTMRGFASQHRADLEPIRIPVRDHLPTRRRR